jgi:two-component system cell cycle sensor histidine kinase/response regulator CckA
MSGDEVSAMARRLAPRVWILLAVAAAAGVVAWLSGSPMLRASAAVAGLTLVALALGMKLLAVAGPGAGRRLATQLAALLGADASPCFTTDETGAVLWRNEAATGRFGATAATLTAALSDHFANPGAVLFRLQVRAANQGSARDDVVTRRGHLRLSVHRVAENRFLWRTEEFVDRSGSGVHRGAEGLSLPMLVASKTGVVLFCNEALRRLAGARPRTLDRILAAGSFKAGDVVELSGAEGPVRAIVAEVEGPGERRELYFFPVPEVPSDGRVSADFENLPVAAMVLRRDGRCRAANRAARELLGLDEGGVPRLQDLFEGPGREVGDWLADIVDERLPGGSEVLRQKSAPSEVFQQVTLRRMVEDGTPMLLAVLQDATALKTLEVQFVQGQKMQAIGQLAGGVAHDFNNLLTAISGHCDLILLRHTTADPDYADLVQIRQNANRAAGVVGQLLAFSRKQTLRPERIDLQDVLSEMVHLLNRLVGERVTLRFVHGAGLGPIRTDRRQLEQVVMNLVVNARDAMPQGGTIRVETRHEVLADELSRDRAVVPAGPYAVVRVEDTGTGIPADLVPQIFDPFFTTKGVGEGTGLGLSTVYGIVKQSGGYIFVDSTEGKGTSFEIFFPVQAALPAEPEALPAREASPRSVVRPGEGVVMLVEDEAPVRAFASRALRLRGWTVIEAENAEAALKALEDPDVDVDVVVTDVVMPGLDGPTWVKQALERRPNTRVVFMSGYAEDVLTESREAIRNAVFLQKPFSLNDLTATVQRQLH